MDRTDRHAKSSHVNNNVPEILIDLIHFKRKKIYIVASILLLCLRFVLRNVFCFYVSVFFSRGVFKNWCLCVVWWKDLFVCCER